MTADRNDCQAEKMSALPVSLHFPNKLCAQWQPNWLVKAKLKANKSECWWCHYSTVSILCTHHLPLIKVGGTAVQWLVRSSLRKKAGPFLPLSKDTHWITGWPQIVHRCECECVWLFTSIWQLCDEPGLYSPCTARSAGTGYSHHPMTLH